MLKTTLFAALMAVAASTATAADFVLGLGATDFSEDDADNGAAVALEIHGRPFYSFGKIDISFAGSFVVHDAGDLYAGAGVSFLRDFENRWFIEASLMPGLYDFSDDGNDLGSVLEFRSLIGVGRKVGENARVSVAIDHRSNAGIEDDNPGVNVFSVRFRRSF